MKERVVILGSGESGTGAAILAKAKGYDVFVSDQGQIKDKYKAELQLHEIPFEEGVHTYEAITNADLVIKSPGIPDKAEVIKRVKASNISIIDEIEFAYRYANGSKIIAITGTNGKTTTTLLTYHLLKSAGFDVALAGNVGFSMARQVGDKKYDWYILELSSFQLDGTETFRPDIGILLNITPDHLDRYEYTMQNYVNSKFQLIDNMSAQEEFIYYADDAIINNEISSRPIVPKKIPVSLKADAVAPVKYDGQQMVFNFKEKFFIAQSETTLKGPHNLINTMAAVSAVYFAGVNVKAIREGLKTFKNAPHRLESVGVIKGVEFINDSKATNVDSVIYALGSYEKNLIWIAGGVDKGNDYKLIESEVQKKVKTLICLGKDNEKLKRAFGGIVPVVKETQSVKELVRMALEVAQQGDVVLLSPACASFDLFKNYEDRGNQFRNAVQELKKEIEG
ncbi:UDP-N-acetylmuramoyl-L-alanine--D-glutamate ligase [Chryseosolibacter indicus]|uniref:UDP-N-acetylmuramoylalanine--D-glutamate ligase n=1 Tax=Chryseosolibacter indicus TaxID=2782351 RepID=A0ABS5VRS1_9BACT|nr:UDP-N-acetylmuramoyl-L-alanine--D-glutamate ligase [Chryseosolibacter indicus]MBT1704143.1 UDP-N-acetylmuramoyl-L-alanine--D-glutamate ligase [Chryseosolibacter indicus]